MQFINHATNFGNAFGVCTCRNKIGNIFAKELCPNICGSIATVIVGKVEAVAAEIGAIGLKGAAQGLNCLAYLENAVKIVFLNSTVRAFLNS